MQETFSRLIVGGFFISYSLYFLRYFIVWRNNSRGEMALLVGVIAAVIGSYVILSIFFPLPI